MSPNAASIPAWHLTVAGANGGGPQPVTTGPHSAISLQPRAISYHILHSATL